ncbi:MAG: tyrosine--tRNA ligase [Patescibacteria group bacterium]|nr:tyrosine--tRNA ligase [Patescibacteria group bacterium]
MKSSRKPSKTELKRRILTRGVDQVVVCKHLERALSGSKKIRVKLGIDPTSPDLHLGHAVVLRKLRDFQLLGHKAVFIIGDFTAKVGDPSGRSKERPILTDKEIASNMRDYLSQAGKIIDVKKAEIRYNSEWLGENVAEILELAKSATLNQVSERADFQARIKKGQKVTLLEAFYSLLQGFDSVKVRADVELGGTDQLLNLLMGRQVQRHYDIKEQDVLTVPLIEGTDGTDKMSKSKGNYIGLNEPPKGMFGKIMALPDKLIYKYFELCTDLPESELKIIKTALGKKSTNPMDYKLRLAREITSLYHGKIAASQSEKEFIKVFRQKGAPSKVAIKILPKKAYLAVDLLVAVNMATSKGEARRLITQGGVRIDEIRISSPTERIPLSSKAKMLQVGKHRFLRVKTK